MSLLGLLGALLGLGFAVAGKQAPNIVLIIADDLGWNDVSFHGSRQIPTPNLDALARDGITLNNYYVQSICTPTRSALLTGRYPIHTGLQHDVIVGAQPYGLGLNETILPQYLKKLNYANHIVGKWHLGFFEKEYTPTYRGFDSHYGYYNGMEDYYTHKYWARYPNPMTDGFDFWVNTTLDKSAVGHYSTELFTEKAEALIAAHNPKQPLFLYLAHQAVHSGNFDNPLRAPQKYIDKFRHIKDKRRRTYAAMVSALDDSVGNVTKALARAGILNNTVIMFSTDNGGPVNGFDKNAASNWPLRGCKATLWEGGTRGSGFIWSPLLANSRYTSNHLMHVTDFLPTVLRIAGYNMSSLDPELLDGLDLWDTLSIKRTDSPRTEMLYNIDPVSRTAALRMYKMKLLKGFQGPMSGWYPPWGTDVAGTDRQEVFRRESMLSENRVFKMQQQYGGDRHRKQSKGSSPSPAFQSDLPALFDKLLGRRPASLVNPAMPVQCGERPKNASAICEPQKAVCLFDLDTDPCEFHNLALARPDMVKAMELRLDVYNKTAVKVKRLKEDRRGLPFFHQGNWVPWRNRKLVA